MNKSSTVQMRLSKQDGRLYNPNRDIAHCFPAIAKETVRRLNVLLTSDSPIAKYVKDKNVTNEELSNACNAFVQFVVNGHDPVMNTMEKSMQATGWMDLRPEVQFIVPSVVGIICMGVFWQGVRDSTFDGDGPASNIQDLLAIGKDAADILLQGGPALLEQRLAEQKLANVSGKR